MTTRTATSSSDGRTYSHRSTLSGDGSSDMMNTPTRSGMVASNTRPRVPIALRNIFLRSLSGENVEKIPPPPSKLAFRIFPRPAAGGGGEGGRERGNNTSMFVSKSPSEPIKDGQIKHLKRKGKRPLIKRTVAPRPVVSLPQMGPNPEKAVVPSMVDVDSTVASPTNTSAASVKSSLPNSSNGVCDIKNSTSNDDGADASNSSPPLSWLLPMHQTHLASNDGGDEVDLNNHDDHSHHIIPEPPPTPTKMHRHPPALIVETAGMASRRAMLAKQQQQQQQQQQQEAGNKSWEPQLRVQNGVTRDGKVDSAMGGTKKQQHQKLKIKNQPRKSGNNNQKTENNKPIYTIQDGALLRLDIANSSINNIIKKNFHDDVHDVDEASLSWQNSSSSSSDSSFSSIPNNEYDDGLMNREQREHKYSLNSTPSNTSNIHQKPDRHHEQANAINSVTQTVPPLITTHTPSIRSASTSTTPHEFLMAELSKRGYSTTLYSSLDTGYHCRPTPLQLASYGTALTKAVADNDGHALQQLICSGLSPNPGNAFGESLIHIMCRRGNAKLLQILMEHGGSIQVTDDYGRTPLHDACWRLADPTFTVDSDTNGLDGNDDVDDATLPPVTNIVQLLLESDPHLILLMDARGSPPLDYVHPRDYEKWIRYLKDYCLDKFWPHRVGRHYRPPPPLALLPAHSMPIPDPANALPLEVASMVANGQIVPQEAIVLMLEEEGEDDDDEDDDDDDGDSDIDSMSSKLSASSHYSDEYFDCHSKYGLQIDSGDGAGSSHDSTMYSHTEVDEEMVEELEIHEICIRVGGRQAMAQRCGWKESDISTMSSPFLVGGKWA